MPSVPRVEADDKRVDLQVENAFEGDHAAAKAIDAQRAASREHSLSPLAAFKAYKKAICWSVLVSMVIVMESYDTILVVSFFAYPTFQQQFGDKLANGSYSVPPQWQSAMSLGASVGIIIGIFLNGQIIDRFGTKRILLASLFVLTGFIGIVFAATSRGMFLAGQILCGIPWGTMNVIAPAYAIETAPLALRHYGPSFVNLCWVIGHIIGAGVLTGLVGDKTVWGWKIPLALQWVFPVPLFAAILFAPESPWWLVRRGRHDEALKSVKRLADSTVDHDEVVALIDHTVKLEREMNFGSSYLDCFKGVDLRRTEIAVVCWCAQTFVGFSIQGYQTYFFTQAGMASSDSFKLTLGTYSIAFVGTALAMPLQQRFDRKSIWMAGICCMLPVMLAVGIMACMTQTKALQWAQGCILLVWFFCYGWSVGPLPYVICSEIGSAQLRQKTIAIARGSYYITQIVNTVAAPYILNPTAANLKGKAGFIPTGLMVLLLAWSFFRLPETKGRNFEELDIMFAKKVPARKFKSYVIQAEEEFGVDAKVSAH
ncbi:hypothetical protein EHS25_005409 [Saitozyma podzolica]|uniref:Major facilitator superfamily (MFS) profile domain-containing protein n=1 Tax=Saitozyma podzolica TaxID=1890683 RepID=A0A427XY21_9TREE|nr:hypothetical protein EHS25_005409 [Saitozyma podzolica]